MSEHFIRPDNDPEPTDAEILELADSYADGLAKMQASGYEEYGYERQRKHAIVIAALRAFAAPVPQSAASTVEPVVWQRRRRSDWRGWENISKEFYGQLAADLPEDHEIRQLCAVPHIPQRLSTMRTTPPELSGQGSETFEIGEAPRAWIHHKDGWASALYFHPLRDDEKADGWTEEPLYAHVGNVTDTMVEAAVAEFRVAYHEHADTPTGHRNMMRRALTAALARNDRGSEAQ